MKKLILTLLLFVIPARAQVSGPQWQCAGVVQGAVSRVNCAGGCTYSGGILTIPAGAGGVTSVACGSGLTCTPSPIVATGTVAMTNTSTTVGGTTCTLGASCTPTVTVGGTSCSLGASCTPATTINSTSCSLGGSCTVTAAPSGSAGGDLAGTYPNPTVAKYTATGASTCSGTASFDNSGCSGVFKTSTGAVTIGPGAVGVSGVATFAPASGVPITITGVAAANGYLYTGTAPASSGGAGTNAGSYDSITGAAGGATTGNGTTGGNGEGAVYTAGAGGSGAGGTNANGGAGGTFLFTPGAGGAKSGAGAVGATGTMTIRAPAASAGTIFQIQNSVPTTNFSIADSGNVAAVSGSTLTVGSNVLYGSVADKLNAANMAIASQAVGDILFANTTTTFTRLADVASGAYLLSGGVGAAPLWSTLTLPNAATQGDLLVATGTNAIGVVSDVAVNQVLTSGGVGAVPVYSTTPRVNGIGVNAAAPTTGVTTTSLNMTNLLCSSTAPTIFSGFGTSPSVNVNNGTCAFEITVGNPTGSTGTITLPTAPNGWHCTCADITTQSSTVYLCKSTGKTTTKGSIGNFDAAGAAANWVAGDVLQVSCMGY